MANTVNQPDGTAVSNTQPPGAATTDADVWTVEYEVDFSAQAAYDFLTEGTTRTIGGAAWTAVNRTTSDADPFEFDGSTGLLITANNGNTGRWYAGLQTQPFFWALLDDMMTSLAEDDTLCLQLEMSAAADTLEQWQRYGLGLWDSTKASGAGANSFIVVSRFWDGSNASLASIRNTTQDNLDADPRPDFFEIVSYPNGSQVVSCGVIAGADFPDPLATSTYKAYNAMNQEGPKDSGGSQGAGTWNIPFDKAAFVVTNQVQDTAVDLACTAKKMRVLRRNKS